MIDQKNVQVNEIFVLGWIDGLMDCHLQCFGGVVQLGITYPGILSAWGDMN